MGTDIHLYLERRKGGVWEEVTEALVANPYYEEGSKYEWQQNEFVPVSEGTTRNYDAFAILADVRNGTGFAGIPTGSGFKPLSSDRGLPEGVTPRVKESAEDWGHDEGYLTLAEFVATPEYWHQTTEHARLTHAVSYHEWKQNDFQGWPPYTCGDAYGGGIRKVTREEMDALVSGPPNESWRDTYCRVEWGETYQDAAGWYYSTLLPALVEYAEREGLSHDDLRLVFFFDS